MKKYLYILIVIRIITQATWKFLIPILNEYNAGTVYFVGQSLLETFFILYFLMKSIKKSFEELFLHIIFSLSIYNMIRIIFLDRSILNIEEYWVFLVLILFFLTKKYLYYKKS